MNTVSISLLVGLGLSGCLGISGRLYAQADPEIPVNVARPVGAQTRQPAIYFPGAPRPGTWRKSIGVVFTTTPSALTEEIRVSVPAIDVNLQRGLSERWYLVSRLQAQLVQNHLLLGVRWAKPLTDRLYVSVGDDLGGWGGALRIADVFNSRAYGLINYPNASVGYRTSSDVQATLKAEAILNVYYRSTAGTLAVVNTQRPYSGMALTFMLEQPFYHRRHVSVGLRAAYANFNWQFWSLYDTFDRNLLYPQLIFNFIL